MENPLHNLQHEHTQIIAVLGALGAYVERMESTEEASREDLERFVAYFRDLVDYRHHDKEEGILLPTLVRNGFGWDDNPIATIRRDHDHERYLVRVLRHAAQQLGSWSAEERRHVASIARELGVFLRAHIQREETLLHPAAIARLRPETKEQLARDLERFDAEDSPGERATLGHIAEDLVARYPA